MKTNVIRILFLFGLLLVCGLFVGCAAEPGGNYYEGILSPYYPQDQEGIISSQSEGTIVENPFKQTDNAPTSTFSADVDTASYALFRKHVNQNYTFNDMCKGYVGGHIRTEEMLNYFDYDYNEPAQGDLFGVSAQIVPCPWNEQSYLVMLGLKADDAAEPVGNNLVFLIDVSGSMRSEDKLQLLQKSFAYLVEQLGENDYVSIVTYAGQEQIVLEGCPGNQHQKIMNAINTLTAEGSTNGQAGLQKAYEIAQSCYIEGGNNRIIMASDGDLNVGISDPEQLKKFVENKRDGGVYLSVLGFGSGNFRDDNMEALADHGNGVYYYIDGEVEAEKIFGSEICSTLTTVANDVKLQVSFDPAYVEQYRLIGYENRVMSNEDYEDDTKDAGEVGAGHTVTACYEIRLSDDYGQDALPKGPWFTLGVRWKTPGQNESQERNYEIGYDHYSEELNDDARFAAAIIETAMLLHNSRYAGNSSLENVLALLGNMNEKDFYQKEFEQLIQKLQGIR